MALWFLDFQGHPKLRFAKENPECITCTHGTPIARRVSPSYDRPHFLGGNMLSKGIAIFLMLVAALLATSTALGQSTTTVQGTVTDSKGAVLPNATVVVRNKSTATERTTQTDSDGNYQVAALPVGLYTIEVR